MEAEEIGIQSYYTSSQHYEYVAQQSTRRNALYSNFMELMEKIFVSYRQFYEENYDIFKAKTHEKSVYVGEFKEFLRKFSEIIKDTAVFQIDCITEASVNKIDLVSEPTKAIVQRTQIYSKPQIAFKSRLNQLNALKDETSKQYQNIKNDGKDPIAFYNTKQMLSKRRAIQEQLNQIQQLQKLLTEGKEEVSSNAAEFERYLLNFRKKLLLNKYQVLNSLLSSSKHFRDCLTEIMLLLFECVQTKLQTFVKLMKYPQNDAIVMSQSKSRKKGEDTDVIISNLMISIQEYNLAIDEIYLILKSLDTSLKKLNQKITDILGFQKNQLLQNLNNLYALEETPSKDIADTLDLYKYFTAKLTSASDKIYICSNKLMMLKDNVKKHSDVTLSLLRVNRKSKNGVEEVKSPQIDQLYDQISYDFLVDIILEVYGAFKEALGEAKNYFSQKFYKKKKSKVENSMEISHISETVFVPKKKPCKKQIWLWRDWRDRVNFTFTPSGDFIQQINGYLSEIKDVPESPQVNKYECTLLSKKDMKGVLKVCEKHLEYTSFSTNNSLTLKIPINQISNAVDKVKIFEKVLVLETIRGEMVFSKFLDIQATKALISEEIGKGGGEFEVQMNKKVAVKLLPEEIQFIEGNSVEREKERPSVEDMFKIGQIFVDNITIDQVFDTIYSDRPYTYRGKTEPTFFAYAVKLAKNFNYVPGTYDKPGPEFYTLNPDVKFNTAPKYSRRTNQFDHPVVNIPLMPKFCHCKEVCDMHWISHQKFDYFILSLSTGAPYADSFQVKLVHQVLKKDKGVSICMLGGLFFVKQINMETMIRKQGEKQLMTSAGFTLNEIKKALEAQVSNGQVEGEVEEAKPKQQQLQTSTSSESIEISRLKNQNKILVLCVAALFLMNILMKIFA